jgi:hypothetical protein
MKDTKKIRNFCWIAYTVIFILIINPIFWPTNTNLVAGILPAWFVYVFVLMLAYWVVSIILAYRGWPLPPKDLLEEFETSAANE